MIELLNTEVQTKFDGLKMSIESRVRHSDDIKPNPVALSVGQKYGDYVPLVTYGNFACIVGASKSKKSFLKTACIATYLNGSTKQFPVLQGHDFKQRHVIDFDTEQGKSHVHRVTKRVHEMTNGNDSFYSMYALRPFSHTERIEFIEWVLYESDYKDNIGLISIDGVADLVDDVNDLKQANEVVQKFLKWTHEKQIAILTVIHRNFGSDKATGHAGSAIQKKSETVIKLEADEHNVEVMCQLSRNIWFDNFTFGVDQFGIPEQLEDIQF